MKTTGKRIPSLLCLLRTSLMVSVGVLLVGCGHRYYSHGTHYYPEYQVVPVHTREVHYPPAQIHHREIHIPQQRINQKINNSINISAPAYREVMQQETRQFFVEDTPHSWLNAEDGTVKQVSIVERRKLRLRDCRSVIQSVSAVHYQSFQYVSCD
jgi:hypothetical protein